ncbi:HSP70/90 co-chaperone [Rhizoctonia solani]
MALDLKDEDGRPCMLRIKQRGPLYNPERVALMTDDPPSQPKERKLVDIPIFMRPGKTFPMNFPDNSHLPIVGEKEIFRGTPDEIALEFKTKGNAFFRMRKWWDAREAYIEAFEFGPTDPKLVELLWLNMAAANIELKYWPGVLGPAAEAITLNLKSLKGYFRAARALIHYERYEEAIDCCERALQIDPSNEAIIDLLDDPKLGGNISIQTKIELARKTLEKVYQENHFVILQPPSIEFDPSNLPYIKPALPKDQKGFEMFYNLTYKYPERNAMDIFVGVSVEVPVVNLLREALPGLDHAPKTWNSKIHFDPSIASESHAQSVKLQAQRHMIADGQEKHPQWDPAYQYSPHNVNLYLETYNRQVIKIEQSQNTIQIIRAVGQKAEKQKICLEGGSIVLNVFRPGSKAERLWLEGKGRKGFALAHPKYKQTDKNAMLASGQLRTWVLISPRDHLEEISITARVEMLNRAEIVRDRV